MKSYSIVIALMGMFVFSALDRSLAIPYAIIAGAYLIGEAISNTKKS